MDEGKIQKLTNYFQEQPSVILAFLYGSFAKGRATEESDVDIAVYFKNGAGDEERIWSDISPLIHAEVDLVSLNKAPATLISSVFKTGLPLAIKDRNLYWKLYLEKSLEAEDFAEFAEDYWRIFQRAKSLSSEDKVRLIERLAFLESEFSELERFKQLTYEIYFRDRTKRREIERWTENIINAMIDISKLILASEKKTMPRTYEDALRDFSLFVGFDIERAKHFGAFANLRNLLAHEYLDILYERIQRFLDEFPPLYKELAIFLKNYIK